MYEFACLLAITGVANSSSSVMSVMVVRDIIYNVKSATWHMSYLSATPSVKIQVPHVPYACVACLPC